MKHRATIICRQRGHILLVTRNRGRWTLPGGTIKRGETPLEAAKRELLEETSLRGGPFHYLFEFGGLYKQHHVFLFETRDDIVPIASGEIARCRWFLESTVTNLRSSVPTRQIVALFRKHAPKEPNGDPEPPRLPHADGGSNMSMIRSYEYLGYTLEVSVEIDFLIVSSRPDAEAPRYVAVVRVFKSGTSMALISPLRFGESGGRPFDSETDAIMGGFTAARKIVDDLFR